MIALTLKIRHTAWARNSLSLFCVTVCVNQARGAIHAGFTQVKKTARIARIVCLEGMTSPSTAATAADKMDDFQAITVA